MTRSLVGLLLLTRAAYAGCPPLCPPAPVKYTVSGVVLDDVGQELPGATVIVQNEAAITDEHGRFTLLLEAGPYVLTTYYVDLTRDQPLVVTADLVVPAIVLPQSTYFWGEPYSVSTQPTLEMQPRNGLDLGRDRPPISRDRTHRAWIAPVAVADPNRIVTTIAGTERFIAAPGIPIAFVDTVSTRTMLVPIDGARGAEVALRNGSDEIAGDARLVLGLDRDADTTGLETFASGPLARGDAWLAVGMVADPRSGATQAMVNTSYAKTAEHVLAVAAIASEADAWANARWTSKLDRNNLELKALAVYERLALPLPSALATAPLSAIVDRRGIRAAMRWRGLGPHTLAVTAGAGAGDRGGVNHSDSTWAIGDEWALSPNLELKAGLRGDHRVFGADRARVIAPRASISYDYTKENRSELFLAYQRVSHLDEGLPGDWLAESTRFHDELAAGVAHHLEDLDRALMFGAAVRTRFTEHGVDVWGRWDTSKVLVHVAASSLDRVATVHGYGTPLDLPRTRVRTGLTLRTDAARTDAGLALVVQRDVESVRNHDIAFELAAEGYAGTAGPGARVLVGATW